MALAALLVYVVFGAVALKRPISDFYAGGHAVQAAANGMVIAASLVAVLAYPALAGAVPDGRGALFVLAGGAGGLALVAFLIAPCLCRFGGYTIADFLAERYGIAGVRPLAVAVVWLCSLPALAAAVLGLGLIVARFFVLDLATGLGAAAAMLVLCTVVGGLRSASRAGVAQYAVLLAGSVAALGIVLWRQGAGAIPLEVRTLRDAASALDLGHFLAPDRVNAGALAFCLASGIAALPHVVTRSFAARSAAEARTSFLYAVPLSLLPFIAAPAYAALFAGDPVAAEDMPTLVLLGLVATAATAALLALGSGLLLAMAGAVSYDLYFKSWDVTAPADRRLLIARAAILLVAGLAAAAAFFLPPHMTIVAAGSSFSLAASALLPALLLGLWWKRANGQGALAGMIAGLAVCLYYLIVPRYFPYAFYETSRFLSSASEQQDAAYYALQRIYYLSDPENRPAVALLWDMNVRAIANWWGVKPMFGAVFGVPVGLIVAIATSLLTPAPSEDVKSFVADLRKPESAAA
jgi:cation/acetate symporter